MDHLRVDKHKNLLVNKNNRGLIFRGTIALSNPNISHYIKQTNNREGQLFNAVALYWDQSAGTSTSLIISAFISTNLLLTSAQTVVNETITGDQYRIFYFPPNPYFNVVINPDDDVAGEYSITFFFDNNYELLDEDNMASDSEASVASQQSIKAYVDDLVQTDAEVNALIADAVKDVAYNATTWNTNLDPTTKNTIRDWIEVHIANPTDLKHLTDTQLAALAEHAVYIIAQHYRSVEFILVPKDGFTSGASNVYFSVAIAFGGVSLTNNHFVRLSFRIPSDYVAGQNIILNFSYVINSGNATVDYNILLQASSESGTVGTVDSNSGQYTADSTASDLNQESEEFDCSSGIVAGDIARFRIMMEDNAQANILNITEIEILVPVNTRV